FAVRLIEVDLLRRKRATGWHDERAIPSIEIGTLDRTAVLVGRDAHVGPIDVAGRHIDDDAVRVRTIRCNDRAMRAVRIDGENAPSTQVEQEQPALAGRA